MRDVEEWIGAHDDEKVPNRVRLRVWDRCGGVCSGPCKRKIRGNWELDHIVALVNGGEHRESNFQILCVECHVEKTGDDVAEKSKVYRLRAKHLGLDLRKNKRRW